MNDTLILGSCDCGKLSFSASTPPVVQAICHCTDCRTATGDPFTITAFFRVDSVAFEGEIEVHRFVASSGTATTRESCSICKSVVVDRSNGVPDLVGVVARYIEPPFRPDPVCHMWVRSKAPTVTIDDNLKQFQMRIER